ncbi:restriction endonuclease subunit S [Leeuwenhoekiella aequorea]|uniref:restriction endonuclease subunit S n=1 Tax=Leeuwenhoekiella aequorea TaxID=283736 RepID=UPI000856C22C|nr:type I restriction-modification system, specificity subunit S [uncultured bacterium]|tara:strand:- start:3210 stop:4601 length:1392 start_codon:yes stop_codon:yes gene_type:complete
MEFIEYTIGELALEIKTGKTPPTSNPEYFNGEIPWIGPSDLKGQKLAEDSERKISEIALEDNKAFLFQSGTVLISTIGDIGKTAIVKNPVTSNQQLTGILVNEDIILPELFYYWVRLNKRILENKANTSILSMLNNKLLKQVKVIFPKDFEDQYKIVGRLNRIQGLIDKRVDTIQFLDEYIRSVFLEMFGDPVIDNRQIGKKTLSFFGNWRSGGTPPKSQIHYYTGSIPWFTSGELNQTFINNSNEKITDQAIRETSAQHVEHGSLLIGMYDTAALKTSITTVDASCNQAVAFARLNNELCETTFIYYNIILSKEYYLNQRKGARQKNLNLTKIKNIEVLYPSINHQKRFTKKFTSVELLKQNLKQSLEVLNMLFQATVQTAFSAKSQINEDEVFESLLNTFTTEDLKQGDRLKYLLKWIECKEPQFSSFESYNLAWDRLRELLEDGSIKQVVDKNEIKLKIV